MHLREIFLYLSLEKYISYINIFKGSYKIYMYIFKIIYDHQPIVNDFKYFDSTHE
jgi:hypothetical protein